MGELRQEFLKQTISNLQTFQEESLGQNFLSDDFLRRFFRCLHTIKGTSNTFDLSHLADLAHEIENLLQSLQNNEISQNGETNLAFQNGLAHLLKLANDYQLNTETIFPQEFADNLRKLFPTKTASAKDPIDYQIPPKFLSQLSTQEKSNLSRALQNRKILYLIEVFFEINIFDQEFKRFKQILDKNGEVIAFAHAASENFPATIGFQVFFVSSLLKNKIEEITSDFCTKIEFENSPKTKHFANNLDGLLANLVIEGEKISNILNKGVVFETSFEQVTVSNKTLLLLNEIALHLIRNAIDHAIESSTERVENGKNPNALIKITISNLDNQILLQIEDDGRGIDIEKISAQAKTNGLIPTDQVLNQKEAIELIFLPNFSTSETVSEISGRGVGLDAVKDLIEKANGKIEVQTIIGTGTIFQVYLPKD
ncbi:MAG TPA: ATP-binding protein [Pyrinomonadaceae bacterium]|nr:ATP-binding protein [Pyrinomonadaceae bacterium]